MCKDLFSQLAPFSLVETTVKAKDPSTTLETVTSHLQLVHSVYVLHVHLNGRPIRSLGCPHVQVLMPSGFKIQGVVTVVEVCELGQQVQV
jgi:hypothetical protein